MPPPQLVETACRTLLNRVRGPLPFRWSANPYRGCQHDCAYCFARSSYALLGYDPSADFAGLVEVKVNAPEALHRDLSRRSWRRELIAVGTACDPYQPAELHYRLTRRCLAVLVRHANPTSIVTKSPFILRDRDILQELGRQAPLTVNFSVSFLDRDRWRRIEPSTAPPWKRLGALEQLAKAGVRAGVLMAPVMPGINDDPATLEQVVRAARDHGASFVAANALFLQPATRQAFFDALAIHYPHLLPLYARLYDHAYAPPRYRAQVQREIDELKRRFALDDRWTEDDRSQPGQLRLPGLLAAVAHRPPTLPARPPDAALASAFCPA